MRRNASRACAASWKTRAKKAHVQTLAELAAKDPKLEPKVKLVERRAAEKLAMTEVERRLACEGMFKHGGKHSAGIYDDAMRLAVRRFQQKHMIYESNYLRQKTMDALARPPLANDHQALLRVLRERVVAATGVVEDGSVESKNGPPTLHRRQRPAHAGAQSGRGDDPGCGRAARPDQPRGCAGLLQAAQRCRFPPPARRGSLAGPA